MAWRNYKLTKKSFRFYEDGFHSDGRVFVTLPKNDIYPEGYGFSVNPSMVNKNYLYMADDYQLDICIDSELRKKGERYKHIKISAKQLYEELFFNYEYVEPAESSDNLSKIYGYARCSTTEERQDIDRQKRDLYSLGVTEDKYIYWEYESGTKTDRAELQKLLDIVKEGDTIVTTEVSRLTRSTKYLCEILQTVQDKKIILNIGGSFVVDCSQGRMDPMTEGMIKMWGVFAEMERNIISQRVVSGMKNAAAKGVKLGRPKVTRDNLPDKFWKYYSLYKKGDLSITDFAKIMDSSRTTIYSYISIVEAN